MEWNGMVLYNCSAISSEYLPSPSLLPHTPNRPAQSEPKYLTEFGDDNGHYQQHQHGDNGNSDDAIGSHPILGKNE